MGSIDGSRLKKLFTHNNDIVGVRDIAMPNTTQPEERDDFEHFQVEAAAGEKNIAGRWMYLFQLNN